MPYLTEPEPPRGVPLDVLPGIRRIVANNPSVMTYHGTNTYLIAVEDGLAIMDPGPHDAAHVRDILAAAGDAKISHIVLTHTHSDHAGAVPALQAATGAPVAGYKISEKKGFAPDIGLDDGESIAGLKAVYTPGHANDHLCFEFDTRARSRILFSGDHVMSWSSSIVSPPDGNMQDYYRGLQRLLARDESLYLPGHGPQLPDAKSLVAELLQHRQTREASILEELRSGPGVIADIAQKLYAKTNPWLAGAAQRNVLAHMLKLLAEEKVRELPMEGLRDLIIPDGTTQQKIEEESGEDLSAMQLDSSRRFALAG
jgi:glyoxylase-like metal-dependent hydrolase (beta-lactamase superfamily II)